MNTTRCAIIKTLSYFAIFEYPICFSELYYYLHELKVSRKQVKQALIEISSIVEEKGYYTFKNRVSYISSRLQKKKNSLKKMEKAQRISTILCKIPTIQLIGVSGSLSMNNCKSTDDIDLFFITLPGTLWLSRFCINILLLLMGEKRSRTGEFTDKICPNMFLSSDNLKLSRQNLYTAHEIAQLKVIFDVGTMHQRFIAENEWIHQCLPHIEIPLKTKHSSNLFLYYLAQLDYIFFVVQKYYMKSHMTTEKVGSRFALFHPNDQSSRVLAKYHTLYKRQLYYSQKDILESGIESNLRRVFSP